MTTMAAAPRGFLNLLSGWRRAPKWTHAALAIALATTLYGVGGLVTRTRPVAVPPVAEKSASLARDSVAGSATVNSAPAAPDIAPAPGIQPGVFPPKVVRTADVQVQVRGGSFDRAWNRALDLASKYGGFVTNSSAQQTDNRLNSGTLTLRVPASKLDAVVKDLRGLGTMKSLSTSGNDISGQIADFDGRIKADEAQQAQLVDLLNKARNVADVLAVRTQLTTVQQDLESLRAQKRSFQSQVDYATVNVSIFEPGAGPQTGPIPLSDSIIARAWHAAVTTGMTIVAGALVVLGGLIPLAFIALAVWVCVAASRRRRGA